jgi:serine protease Do
VVAIGNALGELSFSLTVGYVSGIDRDVNTDGSMMSMLQTDAAINSGNSGGPLFNAKGEVIGINTAKYSGTTSSGASIEGISFAIPMDDVIGMLEDLRDFGYIKGASMGVYVKNVDAADAEMYNLPMGVYVQDVIAGKAAEKAGIQARDIITELGGYKIENMNDLTRALRNFEGGQTATVTVWRGGTEKILAITFDEKTPS